MAEVGPYPDVATHLRDELRRAWLRVEYQIRLGWTKAPVAALAGEDVVAPSDIGRLFAAAHGEPAVSGDDAGAALVLERWLVAHRETEARIAATIAAGVRSPLVELVRVFGLTPRQWATLMFALLPEADPNLVAAYRYLARDPSCRGLDGRLLAQLVYDTPESRSLMARDLSPSSPLLRFHLLEVIAAIALLAIAFTVLMRIAGGAIRLGENAAAHSEAALWARSLLDTAFISEPVRPGSTSGRFDQRFRWQLDVPPWRPGPTPAQAQAPLQLYQLSGAG